METKSLPYNFEPRDYQIPFLEAVEASVHGESPIRYFYQLWHRRSGKDKVNIAEVVPRRLLLSPCLVRFVYPTLVMGRDYLWDGMGSDGFRFIEHIPDFVRAGQANQTRMTIPIKNGSLFQISGTDNPDSLRGGNPAMVVFSEWAEHDPYAWDVTEPILRENNGLAIFNTTPKGDNHAKALYEFAKDHPKWFVQKLTVEDTGIFTPEQMKEIKTDVIKRFEANGRSKDEAETYIQQEYYCSFDAPVLGSYYGAAISRAEQEGRVTTVPC